MNADPPKGFLRSVTAIQALAAQRSPLIWAGMSAREAADWQSVGSLTNGGANFAALPEHLRGDAEPTKIEARVDSFCQETNRLLADLRQAKLKAFAYLPALGQPMPIAEHSMLAPEAASHLIRGKYADELICDAFGPEASFEIVFALADILRIIQRIREASRSRTLEKPYFGPLHLGTAEAALRIAKAHNAARWRAADMFTDEQQIWQEIDAGGLWGDLSIALGRLALLSTRDAARETRVADVKRSLRLLRGTLEVAGMFSAVRQKDGSFGYIRANFWSSDHAEAALLAGWLTFAESDSRPILIPRDDLKNTLRLTEGEWVDWLSSPLDEEALQDTTEGIAHTAAMHLEDAPPPRRSIWSQKAAEAFFRDRQIDGHWPSREEDHAALRKVPGCENIPRRAVERLRAQFAPAGALRGRGAPSKNRQ